MWGGILRCAVRRAPVCEFLLLALDRLGLIAFASLDADLSAEISLSLIELIRLLRNLILPRPITQNLAAHPDIHHTV